MSRILWVSNSRRTPSGYGNQTNLFAPELQRGGHEIDIFAFYGAEGAPSIDQDGILTLPRVDDPWGNDVAGGYYAWKNHDLTITLINPFVLDAAQYARMNWIAWTPVEGEPVQPGDVQILKSAKRIWAMSRHGEQMFYKAGFTNVDYVPHGVDTDVFKPIDRDEARTRMGGALGVELGGRFVVAWNAANKGIPGRKGWYEGLAAFKKFKDACPQAKPILYMHTDRDGRHGVPIKLVMDMVGLEEDDVLFPPQLPYLAGMLSQTYLNDVYNVADVYLHPSHGEGFGIPILEAQAAGCPVIVPENTAMTELCFSGWRVGTTAYMGVPGQMWALPKVDSLASALNDSYQESTHNLFGTDNRDAAREKAMDYDYRTVARNYMLPAIERVKQADAAKAARQAERAAQRVAVRNE